MTRVQIVYQPDDSAGRVPSKQTTNRSLLDGKVITVKKTTPDDYKQHVTAHKSNKRLNVNANIPKTLTPKGYTKMQLMMSIAQKKYDNIVKRLKGTNKLYEDPDFPALPSSIGNIPGLKGPIYWKRPKEINPTAEFIVGGYDRSDVKQGMLGDCWLLAVISSMADIPQLFQHCVPIPQVIEGPDYVGVFKFRFWQFGNWVEVLIDDRLPVDSNNRMIFMHSDESNEFWSALMEKAYAKLNGSYANLSGGTQGEAMEDMTGGLSESIDLTKISVDMIRKDIAKNEKRCCLMGCSITSKEIEAKLNNGLIAGHAYSVTGLAPVKFSGQDVWLVRVRNPWGNNYEWKGAWADNSKEWKSVSEADKRRLNVTFSADGEFWMSLEDFLKCFSKLEVCHLGHESLDADQEVKGKHRLEEALFIGEWVTNVSAGGCANYPETYWTNPQYRITVTDADPTDNDDLCTVTVGLMQMGARKEGEANLTIGFAVYQLDPNSEGLMKRGFFTMNRPIAMSEFTNSREVVKRLRVKPGTYMIFPSTFEPKQERKFLLRVFTEVPVKEAECDDKNGLKGLSPEILKALKEEEAVKNEDAIVDKLFESKADKRTKAINAEQLMEILNKSSLKSLCTDSKGFNMENARSMLAAMDNNLTGKMEYDEFKDLWECCQCWKVIFTARDKDRSRNLNVTELREALSEAGFNLSSSVFSVVVQRFVTRSISAVTFEDWILCCVRLKNAFENTKAQSKTNDGHLIFTEEDYLRLSINQ
ncbi:hypothetical protein AAHC03_05663 [Spirometra sp. Aus1]